MRRRRAASIRRATTYWWGPAAAVAERLLAAINAHDLEAMVACFADDYGNEWPAHPQRSFHGSQRVRRNWSQIFAGVPDLRARLPRIAVDGDTVWTEWDISGTRGGGTAFLYAAWPSSALPRGAWPGCGSTWNRSRRPAATSTPSPPGGGHHYRRYGRDRGPVMILVAGGTGTLGTQVVRRLSDQGLDMQVLTRDANLTLIRAATAADVRHLVLVSVLGAAPDHPMSLHRAKCAAKQALQASGLQWTILRPAAYLETWIAIIGVKLADSGQALVFGPGRNPVNFVSVDDVTAVIDLAVHDPSLRGQLMQVERLITVSGKPGCTRHIPLPLLRTMSLLARPVAPAFARHVARLHRSPDTTGSGRVNFQASIGGSVSTRRRHSMPHRRASERRRGCVP
jgi:uncharacterized protein YbjT (DUF2867 family)/ketosteroid isomerase-like protein